MKYEVMLGRTFRTVGSVVFGQCHFSTNTAMLMSRGALIVLEGCDRTGKTTQCRKIVQGLNDSGTKAKMRTFPDRSTPIGCLIDAYLKKECEMEDHAVHLLFTANRWELMPGMKKDLEAGVTLVVDRYSFSGVAFSGAKSMLDLEWCFQPEQGVIRPDVVLYFDVSLHEAAKRGEYGSERYEVRSFQEKVAANYAWLRTEDWQVIDGSKSVDEVYKNVMSVVKSVISKAKSRPIRYLELPKECSIKTQTNLINGNSKHHDSKDD